MKDYKYEVEVKSKEVGNKTCIDCRARNPRWASLKYGVFMCLDCAGVHRSLGTNLDFIKSVCMDEWNEQSYQPFVYGGNQKFREYIKENGLSGDISSLYREDQVIKYSKLLMDAILVNSGFQLSCAEKRRQCIGDSYTYSYVQNMKHAASKSTPKINYSDASSLLSSFKAKFSANAKIIKEKTVKYSTKIGGQVILQTKNLINKSNEAVAALRRGNKEQERQQQCPSTYTVKYRESDWY